MHSLQQHGIDPVMPSFINDLVNATQVNSMNSGQFTATCTDAAADFPDPDLEGVADVADITDVADIAGADVGLMLMLMF